MVSAKNSQLKDSLSIDKLDQRENKKRDEPAKQLISIPLREDNPKKSI